MASLVPKDGQEADQESKTQKKVSLVLPASGVGERVASSLPKQFLPINGHPLLFHTIVGFSRIDYIDTIVVVIPDEFQELVQTEIVSKLSDKVQAKLRTVIGGKTRHRSISAGIKALDKDEPDLVVVHDGCRPLVDEDLLRRLVDAANIYGAAGPVCKLSSTVLATTEDGFLDHALERDKYRASEMPQVFKYSLIREAYEKCSAQDFEHGTECLDLVKKYVKAKVKFVDGDPNTLWKVTFKKDIYAASCSLKETKYSTVSFLFKYHSGSGKNHEKHVITSIERSLKSHFTSVNTSAYSPQSLEASDPIIFVHFCDFWELALPTIRLMCLKTDSNPCLHVIKSRCCSKPNGLKTCINGSNEMFRKLYPMAASSKNLSFIVCISQTRARRQPSTPRGEKEGKVTIAFRLVRFHTLGKAMAHQLLFTESLESEEKLLKMIDVVFCNMLGTFDGQVLFV